MYDVDSVIDDYITCALWSSTDDHEEPMDANYGPEDLADETRDQMRADVVDFLALIERERPGVTETMQDTVWSDPGQVGHDFWLTRNGHGTGFWDRYYGDPGPGSATELGNFLAEWARSYGEAYLYVGDDRRIYQM